MPLNPPKKGFHIASPHFHTPIDCTLAVLNWASESPLVSPISELCESKSFPERHNQRSSHAWTSSSPVLSSLLEDEYTSGNPPTRAQPQEAHTGSNQPIAQYRDHSLLFKPQWIQIHRPIFSISNISKNSPFHGHSRPAKINHSCPRSLSNQKPDFQDPSHSDPFECSG